MERLTPSLSNINPFRVFVVSEFEKGASMNPWPISNPHLFTMDAHRESHYGDMIRIPYSHLIHRYLVTNKVKSNRRQRILGVLIASGETGAANKMSNKHI